MGEAPKHYYIDERYDKCIDLFLRRIVYGGLAGGLAALVLFSESRLPSAQIVSRVLTRYLMMR